MKKCDAMIDYPDDGRSGVLRLIGDAAVMFFLGLFLARAASAGTVFAQPPAGGNDAFSSIFAAQSADDFVLSANTAVSGVVWWGAYSAAPATLPTDAFRVRISVDDGTGRPTIDFMAEFTQAPTRTPTSLTDVSGADVYRYELGLPALLPLAGGKTFYLSVVNEFDIGDPNADWYWLLSDAAGANYYRAASGDPWEKDASGNFSFAINADSGTPVPVPGTLPLLLSGLAGLRLGNWRRRGSNPSPRCATKLRATGGGAWP